MKKHQAKTLKAGAAGIAKHTRGKGGPMSGKRRPTYVPPIDEFHDCEICGKTCSHNKGEDEVCSRCGLVICQAHCRLDGERPVCTECFESCQEPCEQCGKNRLLHRVKFESDNGIGSMSVCVECDDPNETGRWHLAVKRAS